MKQSVISETKTKWYTSLNSTFGTQTLIKLRLPRIFKKKQKFMKALPIHCIEVEYLHTVIQNRFKQKVAKQE